MNIMNIKSIKVFAYPVLVLSMSFSSCSTEDGFDAPREMETGQPATFRANALTAETKAIGTKVSLTPSETATGNDDLKWENNDVISFHFFSESANRRFNSPFTVGVESNNSATLSGSVPSNAGTYNVYAISPDNNQNFAGATLGTRNLTIPQSQSQSSNNNTYHLKNLIYLYAKAPAAITVYGPDSWTGDVDLDFDIIPSFLRFDITNGSTHDLGINDITIKYRNAGTGSLFSSVSLDESTGLVTPNNTNKHSFMGLSVNSGLSSGDTYTGYLALFPTEQGGILDIDLDIYNEAMGVSRTASYSVNVDAFEKSTRYSISVDLDGSDFLDQPLLGSYDIFGYHYETLTYRHLSGEWVMWMTQPANWPGFWEHQGSQFFKTQYSEYCPNGWQTPSQSDLLDLFSVLKAFPNYAHLFGPNGLQGLERTTINSQLHVLQRLMSDHTYIYSSTRDVYPPAGFSEAIWALRIGVWPNYDIEIVSEPNSIYDIIDDAHLTTEYYVPLRCVRITTDPDIWVDPGTPPNTNTPNPDIPDSTEPETIEFEGYRFTTNSYITTAPQEKYVTVGGYNYLSLGYYYNSSFCMDGYEPVYIGALPYNNYANLISSIGLAPGYIQDDQLESPQSTFIRNASRHMAFYIGFDELDPESGEIVDTDLYLDSADSTVFVDIRCMKRN